MNNKKNIIFAAESLKRKIMSEERFQNLYRISSARAKWHDYNGGMYFITLCTQNREHFFGEIQNGVMHLTEIGKYTQDCVQDIPSHNPYAEIPLFVIMPNHIHLVVTIDGGDCRDVPWRVSTIQNINPYFIDIQYITPPPPQQNKIPHPPKIPIQFYVFKIKNHP